MTDSEEVVKRLLTEYQSEIRNPNDPTKTIVELIDPAIKAEDVPRTEGVWQELLVYFLNPHQEHGFGPDILHCFLNTIEEETSIRNLSRPTEGVTIEQEKWTSSGDRIDVLLTHNQSWFICLEMKVKAEEHQRQTKKYFDAKSIAGRSKSMFPDQGHHYLYLTLDETSANPHDSFDHLTWESLERGWRRILKEKTDDLERYPTLGAAQFAEFLRLIRHETMTDRQVGSEYYVNIDSAERGFTKLASNLSQHLVNGIEDRLPSDYVINVSSWGKGREFPEFSHTEPQNDYNYIDIYHDPLWKAGRSKPAIVTEVHFLLRPHLGPPEYQLQPGVAIHFDIRGGKELKGQLRDVFESRGLHKELMSEGYGSPHINAKWHYLSKVIKLHETDTPITDILSEIEFLSSYFDTIDEIVRMHSE